MKKQREKIILAVEKCLFANHNNCTCAGEVDDILNEVKKEIVKKIKAKKFPRGERKWCIDCANNICKFIKDEKEIF